jgi:hypothetical protein
MIPTACSGPARILRRVAAALLLGVASVLPGCASERETTVLRSARARQAGAMRAERDRFEREMAVWEATRDEAIAAIDAAKAESVRRSSELRAVRAELARQITRLRVEEE